MNVTAFTICLKNFYQCVYLCHISHFHDLNQITKENNIIKKEKITLKREAACMVVNEWQWRVYLTCPQVLPHVPGRRISNFRVFSSHRSPLSQSMLPWRGMFRSSNWHSRTIDESLEIALEKQAVNKKSGPN